MTKTLCYSYLGDNGTLLTVIHLEGVYSIKKYMLDADQGKLLTRDGKHFIHSILVPESEVDLWYEVNIQEGQE